MAKMDDDCPGIEDKKTQPSMGQAMCGRAPTHEVLRQRARHLREESHRMEKLADELERRRLGPEADQVLWDMIVCPPGHLLR